MKLRRGALADLDFSRTIFRIFFVFFILIFCLILISADPPSLHVIQGFVFNSNGAQSASGVFVKANATSTLSIATTRTFGPPGNTGFYSVDLNASDGELVILTSFNSTHYGRTNISLLNAPSVTRTNLTLNLTRPPETDVNITSLSNNSYVDRFEIFNVSFNVSAIGGTNSTNCNATISFSNENVLNVSLNENSSKQLGNIGLGSTVSSYFSLEGLNGGTSVITIRVLCSSDGENFEGLNYDVRSINVASLPPQLHSIQGYVFQSDNSTQVPSGTNVTINATSTGSEIIVRTSGPPGHTGFYSANIFARDGEIVTVYAENETHYGIVNISLLNNPSVTRINFSLLYVLTYPPYFSNVLVEDLFSSPADEIDLTVAGTTIVNCSGNVSDPDGYEDIVNVSAVFYDSSETTLNAFDDNNNHYTNFSCVLTNCAGLSCDVDCIFQIQYYANSNLSDSWICYLNATDSDSNSGFGSDLTSINALLAISFDDYLNFGTVGPNEVSNETVGNLSNVGNVAIDIYLEGYARTDGDGFAMNCSDGTNISVQHEKYNLTSSNPGTFSLSGLTGIYRNLSSSAINETGFNLNYRMNDSLNEAWNSTYWRIYLPPGISQSANCSGFVTIGVIADI